MMSSVDIKGNSSVRMNGQDRGLLPRFVLITPAHNEEALIKKTIESVISQTILPMRWVIVDDGSTDSTAEIVQGHAKQFRWIELIQRPQRQDRSFAGKASAFNAGFERVRSLQFEVIGNLDADVSFERDYFEFLMSKFAELPQIRVSLAPLCEKQAMMLSKTVSTTRAMSLEPASYSGGSALRRLEDTRQLNVAGSIGSQCELLA